MTLTTIMTSSSAMPIAGMTWQERLEGYCREAQIQPPVFQMYSDRRGGRTAWSSRVTIDGHSLSARYWYDGRYLNNAREDVAEVAYNWLMGGS